MQATIEITSQRGQASGTLVFNPARFTGTPEHDAVRESYDALIAKLNELAKNPEVSKSPTVESAAVTSGLASVFAPPGSNVQAPLAFSVNVLGGDKDPATPPAPPAPVDEKKAPAPVLPISGGNSAAQERLNQAAENLKNAPKTAGAVVPNAPQSQNLTDLAQTVKPAAEVKSETKVETKSEAPAETKSETKADASAETKSDVKSDAKEEAK